MKLLGILLLTLFLLPILYAEEVPIGLQKILAFNQQEAERAATNLSLFIAFIAGALTFLSPCILPLLPAYFSYTFKEKKNITLMTLVFFAGFALVFMGFGVAAGFIGATTLDSYKSPYLSVIAGTLLIIMGVLSIFNKGIGELFIRRKPANDTPGVFLSGISFAFGWSACVGPILVGILSIAALLGDMFMAVLLMLFYALGIFLPLIIVSMFYDKFKKKTTKQRTVKIGNIQTPLSNVIAGTILILLGLVFVVKKNTAFVNGYDFLGTKDFFYSIQGYLFNHPATTWIGVIVFFVFIGSLILFFKRKKQ